MGMDVATVGGTRWSWGEWRHVPADYGTLQAAVDDLQDRPGSVTIQLVPSPGQDDDELPPTET